MGHHDTTTIIEAGDDPRAARAAPANHGPNTVWVDPDCDEARAWAAAQDAAWEAALRGDPDSTITPSSPPSCLVLLFGLGLLAFEGVVRWLA